MNAAAATPPFRSEVISELPGELYIETTNRCNLRCRTCPQHWGMDETSADLSPAQVRRILGLFPGVSRVVLHGIGEPLLNRELPSIVREVKRTGAYTLFNSNGLLLRGRIARSLVEEGLDELRVSVDSATPETYEVVRGVDGFGRILANLRDFATVKHSLASELPKVSFWLTGMKTNISELPGLVALAAEVGISEVYLQRLVYSGRSLAVQDESLFGTTNPPDLAPVRQAEALAASLGVTLRGSGEVGTANLVVGATRNARPYQRCRRPWTLMYVTANGNVLPCCIAPFTGVPYGTIVLGNLFTQSIEGIWNGAPYRQWRRSMLNGDPPAACANCGTGWSL
jgi:MoaA/NifB/PqqE/SkfB family radical SAM enzyme